MTAYIIEKRDTKRNTWAKVDKVEPGITSYSVQNLVEGVDYYFRITAENSEGLSKPLDSDRPFKPRSPYGRNWNDY